MLPLHGATVDPLVTVVVPTYNRRESLLRMLQSLSEQTYSPDGFEVVVVDDGSSDGTAERLRELRPPFGLRVLSQQNQGPAVARNRGVAEARGRLIVFLDDDIVARPNLLAEHVAAHEGEADPVVIGTMMPPHDWPRPVWVRWEEEHIVQQYRAMMAGEYACTARQFFSGNVSLSRARFQEAGGFDPAYKRAEDLEFAYRMRDLGASFVFNPRAEALHYAWRSFDAWRRIPYQYGRYEVIMGRDKGHESLRLATTEFRERHPLIRALVRVCVDRPARLGPAMLGLRGIAIGADRLGVQKVATLALSGIFNLQYWQGFADEVGGADRIWQAVAARRPVVTTP